MPAYDDFPSAFPGFDGDETTESLDASVRNYVYTRLTRDYLHNVADRYPLPEYQRLIVAIAEDLRLIRKYLASQGVKVAGEPEDDGLLVQWRWWRGSRSGLIGGTRIVLKTQLARKLEYYGRVTHEW